MFFMIRGLKVDMNFEKEEQVSEHAYLEMIRQKTAVLLGFSMELGAILADAPEDHQILLKEFGISIGLGFQLKDDLLDVYGDQAKFGKQVGGDIISNKKTYLLTKALDLAEGEILEELQQWLSQADFTKEEKVASVTRIYDLLGVRERTEEKISHYFNFAYRALDQLAIEEERLTELRAYADYLTHRDR